MSGFLHGFALGLYLVVAIFFVMSLAKAQRAVPRTAALLIVAAVMAHAGALVAFAVRFGELPLVGVAPSLATFSFLLALCLLGTAFVAEARPLGLVLAPIVTLLLAVVAVLGFAPAGTEPEFRGLWFAAHVVLAFIGYAALAVAFAASTLYLLQFRELKTKHFGRIFRLFPSLEMLDRVAGWALRFGFPALTAALLLGWAWTVRFKHSLEMSNPKVLWALFSWLVFAAALASRRGGAEVERRAARISIVAFVAIVVAYVVLRISASHGRVFL